MVHIKMGGMTQLLIAPSGQPLERAMLEWLMKSSTSWQPLTETILLENYFSKALKIILLGQQFSQ